MIRNPGTQEKKERKMPLEHEELTSKIIAAAIEVHSTLGPGFLESIYQRAFEIELRLRAIPFEREKSVCVKYKGKDVGEHRLDFFVFSQIVVELKAIKELDNVHFATVRSYLRAVGREHGLILNFAQTTIEPKRVRARPSH